MTVIFEMNVSERMVMVVAVVVVVVSEKRYRKIPKRK